MNFSDAIRARIVELLDEKNMNVNKLANRAGLNPSTIRSILRKRCKCPKAETLYYICIGFDIDLKQFYDAKIFENVIDDD